MSGERRGGFFKVRALAWEPEHYKAAWTPENQAPEWWAEIDVQWQIDHGTLMSVRKLADFIGWTKRSTEGLLARCRADLESWDGTLRGQKRTAKGAAAGTLRGHPDKEETTKSNVDGDSPGTLRGQSGDSPGTPRVRAIPYSSDSDPDPDPDTTHTERARVVSSAGEGQPEAAEPVPDRPLIRLGPVDRSRDDRSRAEELVRDWHRMLGRPVPMVLTGVDLACELVAAHGEGAFDVVRLASQTLKERGMLAKTISFGGLKTVLAVPTDETVSSVAAPPAPPPSPDPKDVFRGDELAHAEAMWRQAMLRRIGPQNMEIWIANLRVGLLAANYVRLEAESAYYTNWIEDNLGGDIEAAWAEVLGARPRMSFAVAAPPASAKVEPAPPVGRAGEKQVGAPQSPAGPALRLVGPEDLPRENTDEGGELIELRSSVSAEASDLLRRARAAEPQRRAKEAGHRLAARLARWAEVKAGLQDAIDGRPCPAPVWGWLREAVAQLEVRGDVEATRPVLAEPQPQRRDEVWG